MDNSITTERDQIKHYIERRFEETGYTRELAAYIIMRDLYHLRRKLRRDYTTGSDIKYLKKNLFPRLKDVLDVYGDDDKFDDAAKNVVYRTEEKIENVLKEEYRIETFEFTEDKRMGGMFYSGLEVSGIEDLLDLIVWIDNVSKEEKVDFDHVKMFFWLSTHSFYSPMHTGLDRDVGNFIYRLSDKIPEDIRSEIGMYPNDRGTIYEKDSAGDTVQWDSLQQWREEWEHIAEGNFDIPEFTETLPERVFKMLSGYSIEDKLLEFKEE